MEDLTGKQLGSYQVVAPLGEGGMAAVYRAYQPSIDRYVALKILPRHFSNDPEFVQRFKQEAHVIANLQHPHILPIHDFGQAEGFTYMAMRFIRGGELSQWMSDNHPLSFAQIRRVITQIGDALDYAHSQNVIHRDVKPSNVLIDERGNCLLTDFGLAKIMQSSVKLTRTGGILGTPAYMSPEQGVGQDVDHRSDIYALGVILYEMVTGRPPYQAETPMAIMIKHMQAPLPPPHQYNPDLPEDVERVILKALAKKKEDRFATAGELVQALQQAKEQPTVAIGTLKSTAAGIVPPPQIETEIATVPIVPEPAAEPDPQQEIETAVATPQPVPGKRRRWLYAVVGVVVILAALGLLSLIDETVEPADIEPFVGDIPAEIESIVNEAHDNWDNGDLVAALEGFDEAIDLEPGIYDLYCQRGDLQENLDNLTEAMDDYHACSQIAARAGDDEAASNAFGLTAVTEMRLVGEEEGVELDSLRAVYDEALANPLAPQWLYCERGELSLAYADDGAALPDFERCRELVEDDYWFFRAEAVLNMVQGQAALEAEDYPTAVEFLRRWSELDPEGPFAFCSLGYAYTGLEAFPEAHDAFTRCGDIAMTYDDTELQKEAESGNLFVAAVEASLNGGFEEAIEAYTQAIELTPDDVWLYCSRGDAHWEIGRLDEAREDFRECLDRAEGDPNLTEWAREALDELR